MKSTPALYRTIKEAVDKVRIVDTHEHLLQEKERIAKKPDLFEILLAQYTSSDLVSSGMSLEELEKVRDPRLSLEERWKIFKPFGEMIQNTGYTSHKHSRKGSLRRRRNQQRYLQETRIADGGSE